ncbi:MAG: alpha-L-arabinofuranosidase C-terminal domain-containing protein [Anaerolineales bacterium]
MNKIKIDPTRTIGALDRNVFGGFAEHLGRCIYGGIFDEGSPLSDAQGMRQDVLAALRELRMPLVRYPGGNFVSGYRWVDGIGPRDERPARLDLAWGAVETNRFGTDEFVAWCRQLGTEPYIAVNCGDGDMREARDWVEYCNGTRDTYWVKRRRANGAAAPHNVRYWGIGNEVDGPWQIGMKTPAEYARACTEYAKVMKMVDPTIKIVASWNSGWFQDWPERGQLILEQAGKLVDYMSIHWYVGNSSNDFATYMALSEQFEERLTASAGLIQAMASALKLTNPVYLAVDEWNVWFRTRGEDNLAELYTLEDALVVAMQMNAFIRHADMVKMANIAQIVNVIAPVVTRPDGLLLQSIYYPFVAISQAAGDTALDVFWEGDTFSGGGHTGLRVLDVAATRAANGEVALSVVNRSLDSSEAEIVVQEGVWGGEAVITTVNGPDIKAMNTFDDPHLIGARTTKAALQGNALRVTFEPHSVTVLRLPVR